MKNVSESYDALVELLEDMGDTLNRLDNYTKGPPTKEMTEIIVKTLVHLISTLAVVTNQVKQGRLSESILADRSHAVLLNREQRNSEGNCWEIMSPKMRSID